ncbi:MAG: hypothetical protein ACI9R3_005925 [Verrucomicrobiales bacterium]|jgi:hypothetical protein
MKKLNTIIPAFALFALFALLVGCGDSGKTPNTSTDKESAKEEDHGHEHEEIALGKFDIEGISVEALQGHGNVEAGKEGHLVIKLPYKDDGETVVRAWIGGEDRTLSSVGKGDYAPSHDDYDIHAVASDPIADGSKWWLEIEKPDGTKAIGSFPLLKDIK